MAEGEFIDIMRGVDWITARMEENVYSKLVNSNKIPYTIEGISIIEGAIRQTLDNAIANGVLTPDPETYDGNPYEVVVPIISEISTNDRANRLLPDVTWEARLAGAIHKVIIRGKVVV